MEIIGKGEEEIGRECAAKFSEEEGVAPPEKDSQM